MSKKAERKCLFVLYVLDAPQSLSTDILSNASSTLIKIFCEVILNIVQNNLESDNFERKYKEECKLILRKSHSVKRKREIISNFSPSFYSDLIKVLKQYA